MMKAWSVSDKNGDGYNYIIYAETRGKAAQIALHYTDGAFDDYIFTELRVLREPSLDNHYYGKAVLDWMEDKDRTLMVKYAGFKCGDEYDPSDEECASCGGKDYCRRYAIRKMQEDNDG